MKPSIEYADPERAIVDYLDSQLDDAVGTWFPRSSTEAPPQLPYTQVGWDGTPGDLWPAAEIAEVRVTCWTAAGQYTAAKANAAKARAVLLAHPGDALAWRVEPGLGRMPGTDPDTELPFCTFTVRVATRPTAVS